MALRHKDSLSSLNHTVTTAQQENRQTEVEEMESIRVSRTFTVIPLSTLRSVSYIAFISSLEHYSSSSTIFAISINAPYTTQFKSPPKALWVDTDRAAKMSSTYVSRLAF